ncbi:MAG: hypothetical protein JWO56_2652 [Acidobacteria bacterium]|nr:hypothetical protein [Acidobacteriota bacterium]
MIHLKEPSTQAIVGKVLRRAGFERLGDVNCIGAIEVSLSELGYRADAMMLKELMDRKGLSPNTPVMIELPDELEVRGYLLRIDSGLFMFKIERELLVARPAQCAPFEMVVVSKADPRDARIEALESALVHVAFETRRELGRIPIDGLTLGDIHTVTVTMPDGSTVKATCKTWLQHWRDGTRPVRSAP